MEAILRFTPTNLNIFRSILVLGWAIVVVLVGEDILLIPLGVLYLVIVVLRVYNLANCLSALQNKSFKEF